MILPSEPLWWMLFAAATATALMPALLRSISSVSATALLLCWSAAVISGFIRYGFRSALLFGVSSFLLGLLLFLLVLFFSGLKSMLKNRYGGL